MRFKLIKFCPLTFIDLKHNCEFKGNLTWFESESDDILIRKEQADKLVNWINQKDKNL